MSKITNILQKRYLEVKKQESKYEVLISRIKCSKQCTRDAFKGWNVSSKVPLNYLEVLKHKQRYSRCVWKLSNEKESTNNVFSANFSRTGTNKVFKGMPAITKVLLSLLEVKLHA